MATLPTTANEAMRRLFSTPSAATAEEVRLVSHSGVLFWWPAWVLGFALGTLSLLQGNPASSASGAIGHVFPSNNPGIIFIAVIILLVILTNSQLRGLYSVVTVVTTSFFVILLAWLGWWDSILEAIPQLSARANAGFYFLFSTSLLVVWLLAVMVFDNLVVWTVRPGQLTEVYRLGGRNQSYDTNGIVFERRSQGLFRDIILGLGAGDLTLTIGGPNAQVIQIRNVLFVNSKVAAIQRLVAVKPDMAQSS